MTAEDAAGNVGPAVERGERDRRRHDGADGARHARRDRRRSGSVDALAGARRPTTSASSRYNVHRSTTPGFTPTARTGSRSRPARLHGHRCAGHLLLQGHRRGRRRQRRPASNEADAPVTADTSRRRAPGTARRPVDRRHRQPRLDRSTDNVGVVRYNVHRGTTAGFTPTPRTASRSRPAPATPTPASPSAPTTTGHRRGRGRQRQRRLERGDRDRRRRRPRRRAPTGLDGDGGRDTSSPCWTAATDNVAVARYNVHRGDDDRLHPGGGNRIAQPTGTSYTDIGLAPGTYFYKVTAEDAAGNIGPVSNTASATVADTVAPTAPAGLPRTAAPAGGAELDGCRPTTSASSATTSTARPRSASRRAPANRIAQPTGTSYTDSVSRPAPTTTASPPRTPPERQRRRRRGDRHRHGTAADRASSPPTASTRAAARPPPTSPATATTGTLTNATWAAPRRQFGTRSPSTARRPRHGPRLAALDLTTGDDARGAGCDPTPGTSWRTVVFKERPGDLVYGLYASTGTNRPQPAGLRGGADATSTAPRAARRHLDAPRRHLRRRDSRLYVNGAAGRRRSRSGAISPRPARSGSAATRSGASTSRA